MPELPEVETARRLAQRVLAGRRIDAVHTVADDLVYTVDPATVRRALQGRTVIAACRHGKQLWLELDRRPWPGFHFGMTGSFHAYHNPAQRPPYWKIELVLDDQTRFAMRNVRRLGRIRLYQDPRREAPVATLGFDPLWEMPGPESFAAAVRARSAPVKALLLDQSFAAGVGNWVADEVLYQARIAPQRPCRSLSDSEARTLRRELKRVIRTAVECDADADRFPRSWLFHRRWRKAEGRLTTRGEPIRFDTVGGRTSAWVPERQR